MDADFYFKPGGSVRKQPRRVLRWVIIIGAGLPLLYVSSVTCVWVVFTSFHEIEEAKFKDLLIPSRWPRHRLTTSHHFLRQAQQQLFQNDLGALATLRSALAAAPHNLAARLLLAQCHARLGQTDLARQTHLAGWPLHRKDPVFLQSFFRFLLQQHDDPAVHVHARELLDDPSSPRPVAELAALASANAHFLRGQLAAAAATLRQWRAEELPDGQLLRCQIDWEAGYRELALLRLRQLVDAAPAEEKARQQLHAWLRKAGIFAELRQRTLLQRLAAPGLLVARLEFLDALSVSGGDPSGEVDALLRDFPRESSALAALAEFAAARGDTLLARRVYEHCRASNLPVEITAPLLIEAHLTQRDFRSAIEQAARLAERHPDWATSQAALLHGLLAVAHHGLADPASARVHLDALLRPPGLRAEQLRSIASQLAAVGASSEARRVLAQAVLTDPLDQAALSALIELEFAAGDFTRAIPRLHTLLSLRKPPRALLTKVRDELNSDRSLFVADREPLLSLLDRALSTPPPPTLSAALTPAP